MAGNSFRYFPRLTVWWIIITTLCRLMPKSWYQETAQSSVNKIPSSLRGIFLNFAKSCILSCWLQFDNKKWGHRARFWVIRSKIKGVFSRSYCCYGNLLCHKIDSNVFTDDWAVCWYHDIPWFWHQPTKSGYNDPSNCKSWKVPETVLSHLKYIGITQRAGKITQILCATITELQVRARG